MLLKFLLIPMISLLITCHAFSLDMHIPVYTIESVEIFEGDKHGDFKNHLVAILSDGSGWKIHPGDHQKFSRWSPEELIQIRKRTSSYWFKREHKFELYNYSNKETVRVMLVQYPFHPTYITATDTYLVDTIITPYTWMDAFGILHYGYSSTDIYHKVVYLNDGSSWVIKDKNEFSFFNTNDYVYIGFNSSHQGICPFLISGIQREAHWVWID